MKLTNVPNLSLLSKEFNALDLLIMMVKAEHPTASRNDIAAALSCSTKSVQRYEARKVTVGGLIEARRKANKERYAAMSAELKALGAVIIADDQEAAKAAAAVKSAKDKAEAKKRKHIAKKRAEEAPACANLDKAIGRAQPAPKEDDTTKK